MAPSPADKPSETPTGAAADWQRSLPTPFLTKTYQLVDNPSVDDLISWNDDGSTFIIWRPTEFARDLLPKYFKHNNFSSFLRQLNTYGFRKVVSDRWEFANDCFRRGEKEVLRDIQRRKITPAPVATSAMVRVAAGPCKISPSNSGDEQFISSNSSPLATVLHRTTSCSTAADLLEENEKLRKENIQLNRQLAQLKGLCNNVLTLMKSYANGQLENHSNFLVGKALDLLPLQNSKGAEVMELADNVTPKLFGVSIGMKRLRMETKERQKDNHEQRQEGEDGSDVKEEPLDGKSNDKDSTWLELGK